MWEIYFINEKPSNLLNLAYSAINGLENTNIHWIKCTEITKKFKSYSKTSHFVLSNFDGKTYNYLRNLKMNIFGPQVLLDYLRNNDNLPKLEIPLFSTALKNVHVCFTGFNKNSLERLEEKILMMHGVVSKDLTIDVNVLVSCCVSSKKSRVAAQNQFPVVLESWVDELWELSCNTDPIDGMNPSLLNRYRLPIFYNLKISVSGMSEEERDLARQIIEKNGGEYYPDLVIGRCTHLITRTTDSAKYRSSIKWKICAVSWRWLTDSVEKGYALKESDYQLTNQTPSDKSIEKIDNVKEKEELWANCVLEFFECESEVMTKWKEIVEKNGGKVCSEGCEAIINTVTHVIVGDEKKLLEKESDLIYVTEKWLECCLEEKRLVDIDRFIVDKYEKPIDNTGKIDVQTVQNWDFMDQYLDAMGTTVLAEKSSSDPSRATVFDGCRFFLSESLPSDQSQSATKSIIDHSGVIVHDPDQATHHLCSEIWFQPIKSLIDTVKFVTVFYVEQCINSDRLLSTEIDFMFSPLPLDDKIDRHLFQGCVFSFSGYPNEERKLLKSIGSKFGASIQDQMSKKSIPSKNILATTHLIIGKIDTKKYPSSKLWQIPAITKHWIGACIGKKSIIDTINYEPQEENRSEYINKINNEIANTGIIGVQSEINTCQKVNKNDGEIDRNGKIEEINNGGKIDNSISSKKRKASSEEETDNVQESKKRFRKDEDCLSWSYRDKSIPNRCSDRAVCVKEPGEGRLVMFSGFDKEQCKRFGEAVEKLGERALLSGVFDTKITHLICNEPGRSEKFLSAIASGKWVLHGSFIEESIKAGKWMEESEYEWGGPKTQEFLSKNPRKAGNEQQKALANSARRSRVNGGEVFRNWRVCLVEAPEKYKSMCKIIECGGGVVVPHVPLPDQREVTHFLVNKTLCVGLGAIGGYPCYQIDYIPFFLTASNDEDREKYQAKFRISSEEMTALTRRKSLRRSKNL